MKGLVIGIMMVLFNGCVNYQDDNDPVKKEDTQLPDVSCARNYYLCDNVKNNSDMLLCPGQDTNLCGVACYQCSNDGKWLSVDACRIYSVQMQRTVGFCVSDCSYCK